jgi:hypothetical protein
VILAGTTFLGMASGAGILYIHGLVCFAAAALMLLDVSYAPPEVGALMSANAFAQGLFLRRFGRSEGG